MFQLAQYLLANFLVRHIGPWVGKCLGHCGGQRPTLSLVQSLSRQRGVRFAHGITLARPLRHPEANDKPA